MASSGIMTDVEVKSLGRSLAGRATDFESFTLAGDMFTSIPQVANGIHWAFFPDWLSPDQACFLSGLDARLVKEIANDGGVELDPDGLIEKASLWDFLDALTLVLHWHDE